MPNSEMNSRLDFAAFDSKQRSLLAAARKRIDAILPRALDRFYTVVRKTPETKRFFKDERQMSGAKAAQSNHWSQIATAQFDEAYYESVRKIGERHAIIGLEPRWYIGTYALLLEELFRGIASGSGLKRLVPGGSGEIELIIAILKAALIDMELSVSIYFERTKASQLVVVETLERELARLSQGDLTAGIDVEFTAEYETVKVNFNEAVSRLQEMISAVGDSADAIGTGSREIAQASEDLARRTESNAASLEETSASLTQIDERLRMAAQAGRKTVERADSAIGVVKGGRSIANEAVQAMGRVSESAKGIDAVIEGLDKIAFQTRVLAMNAAVEAGRAGEAGRGFAVVADLVSALAMRAEEEAKLARDQLTVTQTDIGTAVNAVERVDGALAEITEGVGEVHTLLGTMAADNQTQSSSVTEISSAISSMDQSTQQNAAMVEQTSAAARNLLSEVSSLSDRAALFQTGKGGHRPASKPSVTVTAPLGKARSQPVHQSTGGYVSPVPALPSNAAKMNGADDWNDF